MKKNGAYADAQGNDIIWGLFIGEKLLSMIGVAAVLCLGFWAELVEIGFLAPVLVALESVACFRIGRWSGRRKSEAK